jgi:NAD-dependent DNA ligase
MLKQGLFPGAVVEVTKGGDIIPDIYSVIEPAEPTEEWLIENDIANCDYNGVDLISKADTSMKRFISGIHMLNLDNVGHSIAVELFNASYTSILDLFNFDESKLFHKYKENSKTLNNIKAQISKRFESINLQHLIKALRVNGIGDKSACNIADYIILGKAADDVNYNVYERHFIESEEFDILLEVLDTYDSRIDRTQYWRTPKLQELPKTAILVRYCLTGSPKNFGFSKKSEFVNKLNRHNFQFEETDVKNCEYLICDDVHSNSSKTKTAKTLLKKIVTYDEFLNIYELNK